MKTALILIAACLPLILLPGCQTSKRIDEIKTETIAEATARSSEVPANIATAIEAWWEAKEAAGETATLEESLDAGKAITRAEWASAKKDMGDIYDEGERRVKEASKGWVAELAANSPGAISRLATGDWIGGIMILVGAAGGAVGVSKKYTAKVVTENDEKREAKYKPGGTHAELEALLKSAPEIRDLIAAARKAQASSAA